MDVNQLLAGLTTVARRDGIADVTGVEYDSRRIKVRDAFVAMRGETTDGNRYIEAALTKGAAAVVTDSREAYEELALKHPTLPVALVERGRRALAEVSAAVFGDPEKRLALTGVTGTNGKTTTAFLVESLLKSVGRTCVLIGTIEYHVGDAVRASEHTTPESRDVLQVFADGVAVGASEAVMEMSSHALEQERVWGLPVEVAIFTNLTQDHLDYHGTMERYFEAKLRLFEGVGTVPPRVAVVNVDDAYGRRIVEAARHSQVLTYGFDEGAEFRAIDVRMKAGETRFTMMTPKGMVEMLSPLTGRVNVYNLLAASAAAYARGLTVEEIVAGAARVGQVPGRFQVVPSGSGVTVVVDYAHTDDALRNLIALARELVAPQNGRVITLFGCGGDRDKTKRPKMGRAAGEGSDLVVLTSDNPRTENPSVILAEALAGVKTTTGTTCIVEEDRRGAIEIAIRAAKAGDIVLIAGKGHEKMQILAGGTVPFDDAAVAAEVLEEL
ncbi:UDP-N-acetylmuramoyl-L-alanyl-D-glutamate--2,6-diaminopimelate ligase [Granulicella aggregans]|uniref:UDP-N-acetylmuramoyl-L-alanyl-D-glutamate--2, 6-diaminopimelate ligase n=1 Tax=Granulicella aggregans TaxID=474949 RepID=UPI0021DF8E39|nr:UDP-N-acetylmuramoyl-L-alanyl-D-glutamate--2,6-diaminopimelate ligase [Granulicella aggregans]